MEIQCIHHQLRHRFLHLGSIQFIWVLCNIIVSLQPTLQMDMNFEMTDTLENHTNSGIYSICSFQEVQLLSALQTSLRLIPTVVCGFLTNVATGYLVKKTPASYLVGISSIFSALACLLMALSNPDWIYWSAAFVAIFLSPMSSDGMFILSFRTNLDYSQSRFTFSYIHPTISAYIFF